MIDGEGKNGKSWTLRDVEAFLDILKIVQSVHVYTSTLTVEDIGILLYLL